MAVPFPLWPSHFEVELRTFGVKFHNFGGWNDRFCLGFFCGGGSEIWGGIRDFLGGEISDFLGVELSILGDRTEDF